MNTFKILIALGGLFLSQAFMAQGIEFFEGTWQEALDKAKADNKQVFLDAYASWCGPCKKMAKNIFTQDQVGEFYNDQFINVKMDMEKGEGPKLASELEVTAYPTYFYFDPAGELVHRTMGQKPAEAFIMDGKNATNEKTQMVRLQNIYKSGDYDKELLYNYVLALQGSGAQPNQINPIAEEYFKGMSREDRVSPKNLEFIMETAYSPMTPSGILLQEHRSELIEAFGKEKVMTRISQISQRMAFMAARTKKLNFLEDANSFLKKNSGSDYDVYRAIPNLTYHEMKREWSEYADLMESHLDRNKDQDWNTLNSAAWNFYEHVDDPARIKKAAKWAVRSVKLEENYFNTDTAGALYHKMGKNGKAKKFLARAIELAKMEGVDASASEKLLAKVNGES